MSNSIILCRQCQNPITFDDKYISQRTGKKIPIDVQTNERHDCPAWRDQLQGQQQQQGQSYQPLQQQQVELLYHRVSAHSARCRHQRDWTT